MNTAHSRILCFVFFLCGFVNLFCQESEIKISSDFPGGNIVVDEISGDTIKLRADQRDTRGYWHYFYFKISGISGKTLCFQFPKEQTYGKFGPGYSINSDEKWNWYGENSYSNHGFEYRFEESDTVAYFSNGFPYTQKDLNNFMERMSGNESIVMNTLVDSRKSRAVEQIVIKPHKETKYKVLITARNHANEMMTNYVLEGIIESVLNEINLSFLREAVEFMIIPFVDKDGVEDGDQGKNRKPWDHNRDYNENSIYPETRALMTEVDHWSNNKLKVVLDLHCPMMTGYDASHIFLIGSRDKKIQQQEEVFAEILDKNSVGDLKFHKEHLMKYGKSWNVGSNYTEGTTCAAWGATIPGIAYSQTIEFPYANISGVSVSKDGARTFGKTIAYSLQEYLINL